MTKFTVLVKQKDNVTPINGATVKATYQDWLGNSHTLEVITDSDGSAVFNANITSSNVEVEATKGLSNDKGTVFVGILGDAHPDTLVLNLNFNATGIIGDTLGKAGGIIQKDFTYLAIGGIVIAVIFGLVYVNSLGKSSSPKIEHLNKGSEKKE